MKKAFKSIFFAFFVFMIFAFGSCSLDDDEDEPDVQIPEITSVSEDVETVRNLPVEISVGAKAYDAGTLTYQWFLADSKTSKGTKVEGAESASFSPKADETGTFYYYCVVTNTLGESARSVSSPRIKYKVSDAVNANEPVVLSSPQNVTADFGEEFSLSVAAYSNDGGGISYQWYFSSSSDGEFSEIAGATEQSYKAEVSADTKGYYFCKVTNTISDNGDGGTKSASAKTSTVIVSNDAVNANEPFVTTQPESVTAAVPALCVLTAGAYSNDGGALSYQWHLVKDGETEGSLIDGETSSKIKINATSLGKTGYYCVITNTISDNGDGGEKSASVQTETLWIDAVYLKDVISSPSFTTQPASLSVAPLNQTIELSCKAELAEGVSGSVSYRWYESEDGTTSSGKAIEGATSETLTVPAAAEKGTRYYYCVAATVLSASESDDVKSAAAVSDVAAVACTGLPTVYVETPDSVEITSKEEWTKNSKISIKGAADESWNFDEASTSIRGRGNSTWAQPKKPYALKLDKKQKILGLPKHKRWVLIANYLDNSFMRNEMAFYLSEKLNLDWTVHGKFVDLVLNGEYKGLYWLGEAIKVDENRVNIDEDKDYLIEMDVYYDETWKFKSQIKNMPYMIKNDDSMTDERLSSLEEKVNALEKLLYPDFADGMSASDCSAPDETYSDVLDIESWAKFWLVNEVMSNNELWHPKSCYFTYDSTKNILKAGPVWDFDWASLSQESACNLKGTIYYDALFKSSSFTKKTKEIWSEYYSSIDVAARIEEMRKELSLAAEFDTKLWGAHNDPSEIARKDFDAYVDFLKETLENKLSVVNSEISGL